MAQKFSFKQFDVHQDQCAMKIGTDGVLLGAWCDTNGDPKSILDVGAGTGVISMMLAQRCRNAIIHAVEIDKSSFLQCKENFRQSNWSDRLSSVHSKFEEYLPNQKYDLIVTNPPFYSENYKTKNTQRDLARFQDALPFEILIAKVKTLLSEKGVFCIVLPFDQEDKILMLASVADLYPYKNTRVRGNVDSKIKRSLIAFSFVKKECVFDELAIEKSRHDYTDEYIELTKPYYLKM